MNETMEKARKVLTRKEFEYWQIMNGKAGTLYVQGPPGGGKSAVFKAIAEKMGMRYLPFDAPAMEEADIGLYPSVVEHQKMKLVEYVPPVWAWEVATSKEPTLIVFEELNRNLKLINGILNVLNERRIGFKINFGGNVFIAATGNLGDADGTVVEELDNAGKGRLIIKNHNITGEEGRKEWEEGFAGVPTESRPEGKVLPLIRKYLTKNPADIKPMTEKNNDAVIVDGRRWTFLSEAIIQNLGYNATAEQIYNFNASLGVSYIGAYAKKFGEFLEANKRFTVKEVLSGEATKADRDNAIELVEQLLAIDLATIKPKELTNTVAFLRTLDQEMLVSYLSDFMANLISNTEDDEKGTKMKKYLDNKNMVTFNKEFAKEIKFINDNLDKETPTTPAK